MDFGAGNQNRTDDLVITNDVLYRLSHTSKYSLCLDDLSIISNKFRFVNPFFQNFLIIFSSFFTRLNFPAKNCHKTVDKFKNKCYNVLSYLNIMTKRSRSQVSFREWMVGENPQGRRVKVACEWCG